MALCDPGWANLPPDLLGAVATIAGDHAVLLTVCRTWNMSMKTLMIQLSPLFLGRPWQEPFGTVAQLHAPLMRHRLHGTVTMQLPLLPKDCNLQDLANLPSLTDLDISGQDIPTFQQDVLERIKLGTVQSLDMSTCTASDLVQILNIISQLCGVKRLCLSGGTDVRRFRLAYAHILDYEQVNRRNIHT